MKRTLLLRIPLLSVLICLCVCLNLSVSLFHVSCVRVLCISLLLFISLFHYSLFLYYYLIYLLFVSLVVYLFGPLVSLLLFFALGCLRFLKYLENTKNHPGMARTHHDLS